jgi:hypothetical protein
LEENTVYLRFQTGTSMTIHLTLWQQTLFFNHALLEQIYFGIFFGILIGLLFYNLFILLSLKEMSYSYIVLLLFGIIHDPICRLDPGAEEAGSQTALDYTGKFKWFWDRAAFNPIYQLPSDCYAAAVLDNPLIYRVMDVGNI